ncbi:hypothetical protein FRB94_003138 [Tulasnella sp. JGI-2019a]|nr:hypothetical protein FRB93_005222 [Tulasnella sp. JGI-2019a]KAG9003370.1 hypothetical protein FRB94_003138 [Tulasnella sp. JGI-2019a]
MLVQTGTSSSCSAVQIKSERVSVGSPLLICLAIPLGPSSHVQSKKAIRARLGVQKKTNTARSTMTWSSPQRFADLSPFHITKFANGMNNVQLVNVTSKPPVVTTQTVIQLFYPAGSINPGNPGHPSGGADFYASPLDISNAQSVTMEYSVFFPANFSWVSGGKLPGLYGGHTGCSGGVSAEDCFSTRLMWRPKGAGELYLYAPKAKQGPSVCQTPPKCDCTPAYGLSIGRGSFYFTPGAWTNVKQTVRLNTPGVADGAFRLDVNGKTVMLVNEVYYREAAQRASSTNYVPNTPSRKRRTSRSSAPEPNKESSGLHPRWGFGSPGPLFSPPPPPSAFSSSSVNGSPNQTQHSSTMRKENVLNAPPGGSPMIGFVGIFFSTFFGGHEDNWATPTDQRTFFKDFALQING